MTGSLTQSYFIFDSYQYKVAREIFYGIEGEEGEDSSSSDEKDKDDENHCSHPEKRSNNDSQEMYGDPSDKVSHI